MDGAKNTTKAGCGGTIRDYKGVVIKVFVGPSNATTVIQAELESLLFGIHLCNSLGITNLWVEVDVMLIIHYINGQSSANLVKFYRLRDIKHCLSLISFKILHILREGNAVADFLAKWDCNLDNFVEYDKHNIPKEAKGLARLDRMGLPYIRLH
ncbi:uncharacterized protein LOC114579866 [Dendrobium catenatum]|uniref:uncharacterized protein LOC114579866 n=1 Tax=Dendrobium catenatum TaxID=906689 RepID=UPI0010A02F3A|nr:uncharacterized protein LOC114579866 [Dendrobium catenatum]